MSKKEIPLFCFILEFFVTFLLIIVYFVVYLRVPLQLQFVLRIFS